MGDGAVAIWVYQTTSQGTPGWVQVAGDITAAAISAELAQTRTEIAQINTDLNGRITQMDSEFDAAIASVRTDMQAGIKDAKDDVRALSDAVNGALAAAKADVDTKDAALNDRITQMNTDFDTAYQALTGELGGKVAVSGVIAAINASPEVELIAGKRLHITGQALIDTAVIKTSMIADAAITNAKIGAVDAAKITTGYLDAARI